MDNLGRFYTKCLFSELLVNTIGSLNPSTILDLGAGQGALIKAASQRWSNANFIATDIDPISINCFLKNLPNIKVFNINGLKVNLDKCIDLTTCSIDVAICNPPYLQIKDKAKFNNLLLEAKLNECLGLGKLTSDIVFLAQNLKLLKNGGELGIIMPDGIITGQDFRLLRKALLINHNVKAIIELPTRIFPKTEAKTHILIIEKSGASKNSIPLLVANLNGQCYDQLNISNSMLENRMDYSFHKVKLSFPNKEYKPLKSLNILLKRGNITNMECKQNKLKYLHSTSFKNNENLYLNLKCKKYSKSLIYAEKGDLIIVRVGRGCVGKIAFVSDGKLPITDCLYVVKADVKIIKSIRAFLTSMAGHNWINSISHGVCAKVLSRVDIFDMPIKI